MVTEMKNSLEGIKSKINETEELIRELEDRMVEIKAVEQNREKRTKTNEERLRDFWDYTKHSNMHIIGVPEGDMREKGPEKIFEENI